EVPALVGGDHTDVLAARLGALPGAAGDAELELVRGTQPAVAQLQLHGQADRVLHPVAAPGGAHAGLHCAHRLAVGVPGLEPVGDQASPDVRELVDPCTEHVDALPAGDL